MGQNTSSSRELKEAKEEDKAKVSTKLKARRQKPQPESTPSLPSFLPRPSSSNIPYEELQRPAPIYLTTVSPNRNNEDINMTEEMKVETLQKSLLDEDETNDDHDMQKMPYMYEYITEEAEVTPFGYSRAELKRGIYLKHHTMKYWVEKGNNCFMVLARGLQITWIKDEQFWSWTTIRENDTHFEVAELLDVCWLEIHCKLDMSYLNPGVRYKVVFAVKMEEHGYGWDKPVNLRLKIPEISPQIHTQYLENLSTMEWTELKAGVITADTVRRGEMECSLYEYTGGLWKRGLLVKGAFVIPDLQYVS